MVPDEEFVKKIEIHYLHLIAGLLKQAKTDVKTARGTAQLMISYKPYGNEDDMRSKIHNLKEIYPCMMPLYTYMLKEMEIENARPLLEKMRAHIQGMKPDELTKELQVQTTQ